MTAGSPDSAVRSGHSSLDIAQYIIDYCAQSGVNNSLTPMQVLKLVYIAHGWMLGMIGQPLISDPVEAWRYGPVIPKLYHAIKGFRSNPVPKVSGAAATCSLSADEKHIVDQVCTIYGKLTGIQLSNLTHLAGSPWAQTWDSNQRGAVISNDVIESHYSNLYRERAQA